MKFAGILLATSMSFSSPAHSDNNSLSDSNIRDMIMQCLSINLEKVDTTISQGEQSIADYIIHQRTGDVFQSCVNQTFQEF